MPNLRTFLDVVDKLSITVPIQKEKLQKVPMSHTSAPEEDLGH